jgi:hypothetical protein
MYLCRLSCFIKQPTVLLSNDKSAFAPALRVSFTANPCGNRLLGLIREKVYHVVTPCLSGSFDSSDSLQLSSFEN